MNYARWNDDELRRVIGADPKDIDAVLEAARRFEQIEDQSAEINEMQEQIDSLKNELSDALAIAQGFEGDYEAERKHAQELQSQIDELTAHGAGLL